MQTPRERAGKGSQAVGGSKENPPQGGIPQKRGKRGRIKGNYTEATAEQRKKEKEMIDNAQYSELLSIARRKFQENGEDIVHDYIVQFNFDYNKIKALLCSQGYYLNLKYRCEEDKRRNEKINLEQDKKCSYCQKVKSPSEFYICNGRFGEKFLSSQCKECVYLAKKKWLEDNREREQERVRRYYAENKERIKAQARRRALEKKANTKQEAS